MRDKIKNKKYFQDFIDEEKDLIFKFKKGLNNGEVVESQFEDVKQAILISTLFITISKYSQGENNQSVKDALLEAISAFEEGYKFENAYMDYDPMIWMVSLGVLCNIELNDFKRITTIIKRDRAKDKLLDFIIHSKQTDWAIESYSYIQPSPYKYLNPGSLNSASEIKTYLTKNWYKGHSDSSWYDSHKNTKVNVYFGYWAWEAAAIAKIKGIDDSELKDQLYYPYDAVHW
jgi:hypothetical protein